MVKLNILGVKILLLGILKCVNSKQLLNWAINLNKIWKKIRGWKNVQICKIKFFFNLLIDFFYYWILTKEKNVIIEKT